VLGLLLVCGLFAELLHHQDIRQLGGRARREVIGLVKVRVEVADHLLVHRAGDEPGVVQLGDELLEHGPLESPTDLGDDLVDVPAAIH
jgi:hypothetical protein